VLARVAPNMIASGWLTVDLDYARIRPDEGQVAPIRRRDREEEETVVSRRGTVFVLSAPSGAGKSTVTQGVLERLPRVRRCITVTTRAPAAGEVDAVDYFFRTPEEFQHLERQGELLESACVHGHYYGTPRWWVEDQIAQGTDILLVIDVQGARSVRAQLERVVSIFLAPPSLPELERRLRTRARDPEAAIRTRLANAVTELQAIPEYDYLVINDDLECAVAEIVAIITAETLRIPPGPAAQEMVKSIFRGDDAPGE